MKNNLTFDEATHSYFLDGQEIPGCSEILKGVGLLDYSSVRREVVDAASKFGTAVHLACALDDKGILDEENLDTALLPYLLDWRKFLEDFFVELIPDWIETRTASFRWRYGVTPDRVVAIKDAICVVEIKTTASINPETALQTAAQAIAVAENYGKVKKRLAVQLTGQGYKVEEFKEQTDESIFIACLQLYRWRIKNYGDSNVRNTT